MDENGQYDFAVSNSDRDVVASESSSCALMGIWLIAMSRKVARACLVRMLYSVYRSEGIYRGVGNETRGTLINSNVVVIEMHKRTQAIED